MKNLKSSGLELKTIQPIEYSKMVEDINTNFLAILNTPGFRGAPGLSVEGPIGLGERGSKWIFVAVSDFADYGVENENDVNLDFINQKFSQDPTDFTNHLNVPDNSSLIYGDMLVLPSGQVIMLTLGSSDDVFVDTGVSFAQVSQLTVDEVVNIVRQLIGPTNESEGVRFYNSIAKNASDLSPALNINMTNDSIIDIDVVGAGPGAEVPEHIFLAPSDVKVLDSTSLCLITGSPQKYHDLIQATQINHNNDYGPGVDDWAAHVILQNSYRNGILLGHKDSESFRNFSRIYNGASSLILTSSYSPNSNEYSHLELSDSNFDIHSPLVNVFGTTLDIKSQNILSKTINQFNNDLELGLLNNKVTIKSKDIFLTGNKSLPILSTNSAGKIIKTYSIATVINASSTAFELVPASVLYNAINGIAEDIEELELRVEELENIDNSDFYSRLPFVAKTAPESERDCNNYTEFNFIRFEGVIAHTTLTGGTIDILNAPDFSLTDSINNQELSGAVQLNNIVYANVTLSVKSVDTENSTGQLIKHIKQEFTCTRHDSRNKNDTSITTGVLRKWTRLGIINSGVTSWGSWTANTMGSTRIFATGAIEYSNNTISHKKTPSTILDQAVNLDDPYIVAHGVIRDKYGHVTRTRYRSLSDSGVGVQIGTIVWWVGDYSTHLNGYIEPKGQYVRGIEYPRTYDRLRDTWGPYKYEDLPPSLEIDLNVWNSSIDPRLMFRLPKVSNILASGLDEDGEPKVFTDGVRPWLKVD